MTRLLNTDLRTIITNPNFKYTVLMMSDDQIHALGFDWDGNRGEWINTIPGVIGAGDPKGTMPRLINFTVIATPNNELNDLSGEGIVETIGGEMIKYKNGRFYAAGNIDKGNMVSVTGSKSMKNGMVYYTDDILVFSPTTIGKRLEALSASTSSPYYKFFQYLKNSKMYTATTGTISGVPLGFFGTFLIPDNNAIDAAVADKVLPASVTPTGQDAEKVSNFIQFHILKKSVINNGKITDNVETIYRNLLNDQVGFINVTNKPGAFFFYRFIWSYSRA